MPFRIHRLFLILAIAMIVSTPEGHAEVWTPFRRGFSSKFWGRARPLPREKSAQDARVVGLDFIDDGADVELRERPLKKQRGGETTETVAVLRFKFKRDNATLLIDSEQPVVLDEVTGLYSYELPLTGAETEFVIMGVGARGEVEEEKRVFEAYDWEQYVKERKVQSEGDWAKNYRLYGGLSLHFLSETYLGLTTLTPWQVSLPEARFQAMWHKAKLPDSKAWQYTAEAVVGFVLPLQGLFMMPNWEVGGSIRRRNLFRAFSNQVSFHPGVGLRMEGLPQGGLSALASSPTTVTLSFASRLSFAPWIELLWPAEFDWKLHWEVTPRFAFAPFATTRLSNGMNSFTAIGLSGALQVLAFLPEPREKWFGVFKANYSNLFQSATQGVSDLSFALAFGRRLE